MTKAELNDFIDENIKDNSNRVSTNKTTGSMFKMVSKELVKSLYENLDADQ